MKIKNLEIKNLFGRFDYSFSFEGGNLFMFHGHNGSGKTKVLTILDKLLRKDFTRLDSLHCDSVKITYQNGAILNVQKKPMPSPDVKGGLFPDQTQYEIYMESVDKKKIDLLSHPIPDKKYIKNLGILNQLEEYLPFLERLGSRTWLDTNLGEPIALDAVIREYGERLPENYLRIISSSFRIPVYLKEKLPTTQTRFINTRRLDYINLTSKFRGPYDDDDESEKNPLKALSEKIAKYIAESLANYAKKSQLLDSQFVESIISTGLNFGGDTTTILKNLENLRIKAQELYKAGILEKQDTLYITQESIDSKNAPILDLYCINTEDKLKVFDDIYQKISLLTAIINKRFRFKKIEIRKSGIVVIDTDQEREISLESLSSGEQHELYLFAELIFSEKVPDLIFIDEPEISLHVEWQESFVDDLLQIKSLQNTQIFIATHSPSIIGKHWDRTFDLTAQHQLKTLKSL